MSVKPVVGAPTSTRIDPGDEIIYRSAGHVRDTLISGINGLSSERSLSIKADKMADRWWTNCGPFLDL